MLSHRDVPESWEYGRERKVLGKMVIQLPLLVTELPKSHNSQAFLKPQARIPHWWEAIPGLGLLCLLHKFTHCSDTFPKLCKSRFLIDLKACRFLGLFFPNPANPSKKKKEGLSGGWVGQCPRIGIRTLHSQSSQAVWEGRHESHPNGSHSHVCHQLPKLTGIFVECLQLQVCNYGAAPPCPGCPLRVRDNGM